jgi:hypothetical protein
MSVLAAGAIFACTSQQRDESKEKKEELSGVHLLYLVPCPNGNNDCLLAKPSCASSYKCNTTTHYCDFGVTATMACVPPDVQFCDLGGHTECIPDAAAYPTDASRCGVRECLADAATCYWSGCMPLTSH